MSKKPQVPALNWQNSPGIALQAEKAAVGLAEAGRLCAARSGQSSRASARQ